MIKTLLSTTLIAAAAFEVSAGDKRDTIPAQQLREVAVTAIKQNSSLDLEPASVTSIGEQDIERLNINTMSQASELVPNFYMPAYGSRMTASIYVRGLGARIDQPAMGLNVDNIPVLNKNDYDFDLFDLERIEVLRGPQSVLYGRNTMGGVINVYSLSPMRYQGVRFKQEVASFNTWRTAAGIYHKTSDKLGLGLDLNAFNTAGQFDNVARPGYEHFKRKADAAEQYGLRAKVAWKPRVDLDIDNVFAYGYNRQAGYPYELVGAGHVAYNDTCHYERNSISDGLTIQWRGPGFTFSSISGMRYFRDDMVLDQDFTPKSFFNLQQKIWEYSFTQDFIFRGRKGGYRWMAGAFGFVKHQRMDAPVTMLEDGINQLILGNIPPFLQAKWDTDYFVLGSNFTLPNWGLAAYHESEYTLGDWTFAAALRLDYEHAAMFWHSDVSTGMSVRGHRFPIDIHESGRLKRHFLELLPKVTVTYRLPMPSPSSVYVSVGKGYKAGGYNTQMFSEILQQKLMQAAMANMPGSKPAEPIDVDKYTGYKPEYCWNYELGAHIACAEKRIHTDMALFYMDVRNQQLTVFPEGTTTGRMMTNAGRTRSFGAEVAVTARPTDRWELLASYGYTNARFLRYKDGDDDYRHKVVPYAPQNTMFLSAAYTQPLPMWWFNGISFRADGRGVGPVYWDESNEHRQNFYCLLGASVCLHMNKVEVDFWGRNILNHRYDTFYFKSMGNSFVQRGDKRCLGVTLRYVM